MSIKETYSYPDFGELSKVFEAYKAGISTEALLPPDALDRIFLQAPAKIGLLRRIRMQWAVGITGLVVVTTALVLELSRTTEAPQPSQPNTPVKVDTIASESKLDTTIADSGLRVEDFRLSKFNYDSRLNLDSVVRYDPNLGPAFREADWNDLVEFCSSPEKVDTLINTLRIPLLVAHGLPGGEQDSIYHGTPDSLNNFFVSWGHKRWVMPDTQGYHFFIGRWDHHRPKWWQRYAQIDQDHLDLGAWTDIHFRILAVRRKAKQHQTINF